MCLFGSMDALPRDVNWCAGETGLGPLEGDSMLKQRFACCELTKGPRLTLPEDSQSLIRIVWEDRISHDTVSVAGVSGLHFK